jgi:hypothetical protein
MGQNRFTLSCFSLKQSELWACGLVDIRPTSQCKMGVVYDGSATVAMGQWDKIDLPCLAFL